MAYGMAGSRQVVTGTYFVDAENIGIKLEHDQPMTWKFKLSDGDLVLTYHEGGAGKIDGSMAKFRRRK